MVLTEGSRQRWGMLLTLGAWIGVPAYVQAAELRVNDLAGVGTVGDERLSLSEAIRLANGSLGVKELSPAEARQVKGRPGATSADVISIAVGTGREIEFPPQAAPAPLSGLAQFDATKIKPLQSPLPTIVGNDGDRIDGRGAVIGNGGSESAVAGLAFRIASSRFTIENLTVRRFARAISIQPSGREILSDVLVRRVRMEDGGVEVSGRALDGKRSRTTRVTIADNKIFGAAVTGRVHKGLTTVPFQFSATGTANLQDDPSTQGSLTNLRFTGNEVRGWPTGIVGTAVTIQSGRAENIELRDILIADNDVRTDAPGAVDPALEFWAAIVLGGDVSGVTVSGVRIERNHFEANLIPAYITPVEIALTMSPTVVSNITMDRVTFNDNVVRGTGNRCMDAFLAAPVLTDLGSGKARDVRFTGLSIRRNDLAGCQVGIFVSGAVNHASPGATHRAEMRDVAVQRNRIQASRHGMLFTGATVERGPLAPSLPGAVAQDNRLANVLVTDNHVVSEGAGLSVFAGSVDHANGATVTGNVVSGLRARRNVIVAAAARCAVQDNFENAGDRAANNHLQDVDAGCSERPRP